MLNSIRSAVVVLTLCTAPAAHPRSADAIVLASTPEAVPTSCSSEPMEREITACRRAGAAIDVFPADVTEAGALLKTAARSKSEAPLDAFHRLHLDDDFDNVRDDDTDCPLGLSWWSESLYFTLWNRAEFAANRS